MRVHAPSTSRLERLEGEPDVTQTLPFTLVVGTLRWTVTGSTSSATSSPCVCGRKTMLPGSPSRAVVIPQSMIADAKFKAASMFVKGKLSVRTTDGHKYRMHFRKKQQGDFERLTRELNGALWQRLDGAQRLPQRLHVRAWPIAPLASRPPCGTCQGRMRPSGRTSLGRARQVAQTLIATADWADLFRDD